MRFNRVFAVFGFHAERKVSNEICDRANAKIGECSTPRIAHARQRVDRLRENVLCRISHSGVQNLKLCRCDRATRR
jgi:hypothetical protein